MYGVYTYFQRWTDTKKEKNVWSALISLEAAWRTHYISRDASRYMGYTNNQAYTGNCTLSSADSCRPARCDTCCSGVFVKFLISYTCWICSVVCPVWETEVQTLSGAGIMSRRSRYCLAGDKSRRLQLCDTIVAGEVSHNPSSPRDTRQPGLWSLSSHSSLQPLSRNLHPPDIPDQQASWPREHRAKDHQVFPSAPVKPH